MLLVPPHDRDPKQRGYSPDGPRGSIMSARSKFTRLFVLVSGLTFALCSSAGEGGRMNMPGTQTCVLIGAFQVQCPGIHT